jgi:putative redox protein
MCANVLAAWAERYLDAAPMPARRSTAECDRHRDRRRQIPAEIVGRPHRLIADEPVAAGGLDSGRSL